MINRIVTLLVLAAGLSACDSDLAFVPPDPDTFVVQAFLFTDEPVTDVSVTGVLPVDADSTAVPELISDAQITLIKNGLRYALQPTDGEPGQYDYPGTDLTIEVGDVFDLEVVYHDRIATATTVVPSPPQGLALSADTMTAPEFEGFELSGLQV